jgi:hypothetical protein
MAALPEPFVDLEPYAARWALPTTQERHRLRCASSLDELQAVYSAVAPRLEAMLEHLDGFAPQDLPPPQRRLLDLCLALADVSLAVEKYRAPFLPDAPYSTAFEVDTSELG